MVLKPFAGRGKSRSWFWWGINLGIFLALVVWWWMKNRPQEQVEYEVEVEPLVLPDDEPESVPPEGVKPEPRAPEEPDNLQLIEGLGPRSAEVLEQSGILTFSQIAAMEPEAIHEVLRAGGLRIAFPETWPEQAGLAAAGKWDALKELQSSIQGRRRS
jgi:predicted flap endonuclease-1-like 5' DNA nuclease